MKISSYKDLEVYQKAYRISLLIHKFSFEFPKHEQYGLADQMRRASKSICANLAEGFSRGLAYSTEYLRYLSISLGSSDEMQVWLDYCLDLGYCPPSQAQEWQQEYKLIAKMLTNLRQSIQSKRND